MSMSIGYELTDYTPVTICTSHKVTRFGSMFTLSEDIYVMSLVVMSGGITVEGC